MGGNWVGAASRVGEGCGASAVLGAQPINRLPPIVIQRINLYIGISNNNFIAFHAGYPSAAWKLPWFKFGPENYQVHADPQQAFHGANQAI